MTPSNFDTFAASFLESLRVRGQSPATRGSRAQALRRFFGWCQTQGITDVREITRERVIAYQLWMQQQQYQPATLCAWMGGLRRFFEFLEKTDAILINPCLGIVLPHVKKGLPKAILTESEARKILDEPDTQTKRGIRDKAILELFYSTGIRGEEMAGLTIHDVDCKHGFVRVKGKAAKDRMVPMGRKASDTISEYLSKVRSTWSRADRDERALWLSSLVPHQPLKYPAIASLVKNYANAADIHRPGRTHLWRHTCATHLVGAGANIAYVQRLLGHRSLRTTQIYTRVNIADLKTTHRKTHPRKKP